MSDTTTSTLAAALWDFDGTLADTEPLWIAAEYDLIGKLGGTWSDEHAEQLVGNSLLDSGSYILNAIGRVDLSPAWVVEQLLTAVVDHISSHPIVWRPGAIELLESFAESGVGVVSGATERRAQPASRGDLPGLRGGGRGESRKATPRAVREGVHGPWGRCPTLRGLGGLRNWLPGRQCRRRVGSGDTPPSADSTCPAAAAGEIPR